MWGMDIDQVHIIASHWACLRFVRDIRTPLLPSTSPSASDDAASIVVAREKITPLVAQLSLVSGPHNVPSMSSCTIFTVLAHTAFWRHESMCCWKVGGMRGRGWCSGWQSGNLAVNLGPSPCTKVPQLAAGLVLIVDIELFRPDYDRITKPKSNQINLGSL